jgi:preprotein translocase subunit YajC
METHMKDIIAEGLLLFSAFATIVVMILLIIKERRNRKSSIKKTQRAMLKGNHIMNQKRSTLTE